ncbi:MAG: hypothetical protein Q7J26_01905 [Brevundimonas sp.]|uniref:hypothetical protein n=1 Tax=Brevundimonas sp. TaxID=1871086 RepID=UPI00271EA313|nr:hypothetical protein [Brevundimonas sp.]MDO9607252.1 hypothetical protein [Brevundimonas sp.]
MISWIALFLGASALAWNIGAAIACLRVRPVAARREQAVPSDPAEDNASKRAAIDQVVRRFDGSAIGAWSERSDA